MTFNSRLDFWYLNYVEYTISYREERLAKHIYCSYDYKLRLDTFAHDQFQHYPHLTADFLWEQGEESTWNALRTLQAWQTKIDDLQAYSTLQGAVDIYIYIGKTIDS